MRGARCESTSTPVAINDDLVGRASARHIFCYGVKLNEGVKLVSRAVFLKGVQGLIRH